MQRPCAAGRSARTKGGDGEDVPELDLNGIEDDSVANRDEERNGHLAAYVHVDLLLSLRMHVTDRRTRPVSARLAASEQEGKEEQNVDDVFDDVGGAAEELDDERREVEVRARQVGDRVLHVVLGAIDHRGQGGGAEKSLCKLEGDFEKLLCALAVLVAVSREGANRTGHDQCQQAH